MYLHQKDTGPSEIPYACFFQCICVHHYNNLNYKIYKIKHNTNNHSTCNILFELSCMLLSYPGILYLLKPHSASPT